MGISPKIVLGVASVLSCVLPFGVSADEQVTLKLNINQPSLFDGNTRDLFAGSVDDSSGTTAIELVCSAGASGFAGIGRVDEACSVKGMGKIKNPKNPAQSLERIGYTGGFTVQAKKDGYTPLNTVKVDYARLGSAPAESTSFGGHAIMMPENPSASARALGASLVKRLQEKAAGAEAVEFDTRLDSVRFEGVTVPHVGLADTKSCTWTGDLIYAYANDSWQGAFDVLCGTTKYRLEGNMPLRDVDGSSRTQTYAVNFVVPGAGGGDPFAAADPFATVDGISGTLTLDNSGRMNEDEVYEKVQVNGTLTGTNVPLEAVRSFGQLILLFARTFFGA